MGLASRSAPASALLALVFFSACATTPVPAVAHDHNRAGAALLVKGRLDDAEARFRLALEYHPEFAEARANLGIVFLHRGSLEEAEGALRLATRLEEDSALAHGSLGVVLERMGREREAKEAYAHALAIDPGLPRVRQSLAELLVRGEAFREARAHLLRLIQIRPHWVRAQALLAYADLRLGRGGAAASRITHLLARHPEEPVALLVRGILRARAGRLEEASHDLRAAMEDADLRAQAAPRLAASLLMMGALEEARATVEEALARRPDDPATHLVAAHVAERRGRRTEAIHHARVAMRARPCLALARRLLSALGVPSGPCSEAPPPPRSW